MTATVSETALWPNAVHGWRRLRLGLLVVWVVLLALVLFLGAREASLTELRAALDAGRVSSVQMTRGLPDGATGYATVQIFWKDGWINRATSVTNVSDPTISAPTQGSGDVVVGDLAQRLHGWDSSGSLRVVANQRPLAGATLMGWPVPGWMAPAGLGLWMLTLWLLYVGPPPRRATRWAWFWTLFSPFGVVAAPLFLAVGGPSRRAPRTRERERERRLTGGWSFLLVLLVAAATGLLY